MILVDTSVWIDSFQNKDTMQVKILKELIKSRDEEICTCATIIQEVLQGVREDSKFESLRLQFLNMVIFTADQVQVAIEAASLYRLVRKKGVTIKKPNDCIIAWYAINNKVKLLHNNSDFDLIAEHTELKVVRLK